MIKIVKWGNICRFCIFGKCILQWKKKVKRRRLTSLFSKTEYVSRETIDRYTDKML
jgi:hypothetical protein